LGIYCIKHRYPDFHQCTINHLQQAQQKIQKENPVIEAEKINKI